MTDAILVLNAGSSSLKFSIYRIEKQGGISLEARGQIDGLGTSPHFKAKDSAGEVLVDEDVKGAEVKKFAHDDGFGHLAKWMREKFGNRLSPVAVGHRMVHGGAEFIKPTVITPAVFKKLEELVPLVPLHQPHNLAGVKAVTKLRPDLRQVACFDTAFHQGRARVTEMFGLPHKLFDQGLRRWGFHGLSYQSIVNQLRETSPDVLKGKLIVAHLGSGASMCAIKNGKSVETTMSFSVLDGLPMGTRCGSLDPGVVLHLVQQTSVSEVENMLYKKSGLLGISGVSNDVRELLASDEPRAAQAIEYFVYRAAREIGSLAVALEGFDALIFTAGIGENAPVIRERICKHLGWLGIQIDSAANKRGRGRISEAKSSPSVLVMQTDEESVIAAGTVAALGTSA